MPVEAANEACDVRPRNLIRLEQTCSQLLKRPLMQASQNIEESTVRRSFPLQFLSNALFLQ